MTNLERSRAFCTAGVLLLIVVRASPIWAATLSGNVHTHDGKPVAGALVRIRWVRPMGAPGPKCEWCYPEVGRQATSDSTGEFLFEDVADSMQYGLLADVKGCGTLVELSDLKTGRASFEAWPFSGPRPPDTPHVTVVDSRGLPVFGAFVSFTCISSERDANGIGYEGELPWSITDHLGMVDPYGCSPGDSAVVEVSAVGFTPIQETVASADTVLRLMLPQSSSTIRGRVVWSGKPGTGLQIKLLRAEKVGAWHVFDGEIATDAGGNYSFANVVPGLRYWVFVPMAPKGTTTAFDAVTVRAPEEGGTVDVPVLRGKPGRTLAGHVRLPRGQRLPAGVRFRVTRTVGVDSGTPSQYAWDVAHVSVDSTGSFRCTGLPTETVLLEIYVPGYSLSDSLAAPLRYRRFDQTALIDMKRDYEDLELPMTIPPPQPKGDRSP